VHFEAFEHYGLSMLGLVESGVVIGEVGLICEMVLAPLRKLEGGVPSVDVNVGGAVLVVEDALIFFNWPQEENDGVVHEGEGLASFPIPKDRVVVCLVLGLGEDANS